MIYGFSVAIDIRIHHHFFFFGVLASGLPTVPSGPLLAKFFLPLARMSSYTTDYDRFFTTCDFVAVFAAFCKSSVLLFFQMYPDLLRVKKVYQMLLVCQNLPLLLTSPNKNRADLLCALHTRA